MDITIGRTVHYTLSAQDAAEINRRRTTGASIYDRMKSVLINPQGGSDVAAWPAGAQAHIGNNAEEGQVYPAVAVRVWDPSMANLSVALDGTDTYWATSRHEGTEPGTWAWPPRA